MKLFGIFGKHVARDLSAFCHGQMPADEMQRVADHLDACWRCRREYEEVRFGVALGGHLSRVSAPRSLWTALDAVYQPDGRVTFKHLERSRLAPRWLGSRSLQASVIVLVAAIGVVTYLRVGRREASGPSVELGGYLKSVEATSIPAVYRRIVGAPKLFLGGERDEVLRVAGLTGAVAQTQVLPGYELLAHRLAVVEGEGVAQLVYGRGEETFVVFIAPARVHFALGKESAVDAEVRGIHCQKLDCPRQETYVFGAGRFHCVLVSKSLDADRAAAVMRYFLAAHSHQG